jgi:hypothetical protein
MFRRFKFWLPLISFIIILANWTGLDAKSGIDDMNIIVYFTSPPFWFVDSIYENNYLPLVHVLTIVFWFLVGWTIDTIIKRFK